MASPPPSEAADRPANGGAADLPVRVKRRPRIGILIVAYNAVTTLSAVLRRIPAAVWTDVEEVVVFDDASHDATFELALGFKASSGIEKLHAIRNPTNLGYGGNQKLGYSYFIEKGFDIVVLLHGDGQYAPEVLATLYGPIAAGDADAVFGSRMLRDYGGPLRGGMPLYKYVGNRILTRFENRALGMQLTEFHSGYRAYSLHALRTIDMSRMTDDFHFDTEIIIKLQHQGFRLREVPIPTYYGAELCYVDGVRYARNVFRAVVRYRNTVRSYRKHPEFAEYFVQYPLKESRASSHDTFVRLVGHDHDVLDIGCGEAFFAEKLAARGNRVVGIDALETPQLLATLENYIRADLDSGLGAAREALGRRRFDRVLLQDVLEHLRQPDRLLDDCHAVLKPSGQLLVSVPNVANITVRLGLLMGRFTYADRGILDQAHLRFFTRRSARRLIEDSGYTIEREASTVMPVELVLGLRPRNPLMRVTNWLLRLITAAAPGLFAYQCVFVARSQRTLSEPAWADSEPPPRRGEPQEPEQPETPPVDEWVPLAERAGAAPGARVLAADHVAVLLAIGAVFFALVTYLTGNLRGLERWGEAYDSLGENLLHLDASVSERAIGWESFEIDGKRYAYFGPFPAALRIVANAVLPAMHGQWSRSSCLLAALLSLVWFTGIATTMLSLNPRASPGQRRVLLHAVLIGFGLGSPIIYLVSCARIYHEAILWGLCGALFSLDVALRMLTGRMSDLRGLLLFSCGVTVTLLSRLTFALPFVLVMPLLVFRAIGRLRRQSGWLGATLRVGLATTPAIAGALIQLWYNQARFGSIFMLFDYSHFYARPEAMGGEFNWRRLPSALANYFGLTSELVSAVPPYFQSVRVLYADDSLFFDWKEQAVSLTLASPWLLLSGLAGALLLIRRRGLGWLRVLAVLFCVEAACIATFYFVSQRYAGEFLPLFVLLLGVFLLEGRFRQWPLRFAGPLLLVLALFSAVVTVASTLHWNLMYNGDAPVSYKEKLGTLLIPGPKFPPWDGQKIYLSELQPLAETHSFNRFRNDGTWRGEAIIFHGHRYQRGIGMHANSTVTYAVPAGTVAFEAVAGLPDTVTYCRQGSVIFEVRGDGDAVLYRSQVARTPELPLEIHLPLNGVHQLTLAANDAGDGIDCDHATWGGPAFLLAPGVSVIKADAPAP